NPAHALTTPPRRPPACPPPLPYTTLFRSREILGSDYPGLALRPMQRLGLLAEVLPEFALIDSLVVRDFYHRYTVDEHTLRTIERSEEHTSELQSRFDIVCRLLHEKKTNT